MKKLGVLLIMTGLMPWANAQVNVEPGERLEHLMNRLQSNKRQQEENMPGYSIKLSSQGQAFVNRILTQLKNAKQEILGFPYPPKATGKNQDEHLEAIGDIAGSLTVVMDEYNAVRKRDVLAARVAGAHIGTEILVSKDGKRFGVQEFLQEYKAEMSEAVLVDELAEELDQFAQQITKDVQSMQQK